MKRYFTHSGIVLGAIAFFGLSFGVAHAQNPVTAAVGSFFSFSLDTIALIATYPLEMLSAAMATILSIAGTLLDTLLNFLSILHGTKELLDQSLLSDGGLFETFSISPLSSSCCTTASELSLISTTLLTQRGSRPMYWSPRSLSISVSSSPSSLLMVAICWRLGSTTAFRQL